MSKSFSCISLVLNRSKSLSISIACRSLSNVAADWNELYEHRLFQSGWGSKEPTFPKIGFSEIFFKIFLDIIYLIVTFLELFKCVLTSAYHNKKLDLRYFSFTTKIILNFMLFIYFYDNQYKISWSLFNFKNNNNLNIIQQKSITIIL